MGRIAAGIFDELIFREDPGTRGRPRGEVMNLLKKGALESGPLRASIIHLIAGERRLDGRGAGDGRGRATSS